MAKKGKKGQKGQKQKKISILDLVKYFPPEYLRIVEVFLADVPEDKKQEILRVLETHAGEYKKKTKEEFIEILNNLLEKEWTSGGVIPSEEIEGETRGEEGKRIRKIEGEEDWDPFQRIEQRIEEGEDIEDLEKKVEEGRRGKRAGIEPKKLSTKQILDINIGRDVSLSKLPWDIRPYVPLTHLYDVANRGAGKIVDFFLYPALDEGKRYKLTIKGISVWEKYGPPLKYYNMEYTVYPLIGVVNTPNNKEFIGLNIEIRDDVIDDIINKVRTIFVEYGEKVDEKVLREAIKAFVYEDVSRFVYADALRRFGKIDIIQINNRDIIYGFDDWVRRIDKIGGIEIGGKGERAFVRGKVIQKITDSLFRVFRDPGVYTYEGYPIYELLPRMRTWIWHPTNWEALFDHNFYSFMQIAKMMKRGEWKEAVGNLEAIRNLSSQEKEILRILKEGVGLFDTQSVGWAVGRVKLLDRIYSIGREMGADLQSPELNRIAQMVSLEMPDERIKEAIERIIFEREKGIGGGRKTQPPVPPPEPPSPPEPPWGEGPPIPPPNEKIIDLEQRVERVKRIFGEIKTEFRTVPPIGISPLLEEEIPASWWAKFGRRPEVKYSDFPEPEMIKPQRPLFEGVPEEIMPKTLGEILAMKGIPTTEIIFETEPPSPPPPKQTPPPPTEPPSPPPSEPPLPPKKPKLTWGRAGMIGLGLAGIAGAGYWIISKIFGKKEVDEVANKTFQAIQEGKEVPDEYAELPLWDTRKALWKYFSAFEKYRRAVDNYAKNMLVASIMANVISSDIPEFDRGEIIKLKTLAELEGKDFQKLAKGYIVAKRRGLQVRSIEDLELYSAIDEEVPRFDKVIDSLNKIYDKYIKEAELELKHAWEEYKFARSWNMRMFAMLWKEKAIRDRARMLQSLKNEAVNIRNYIYFGKPETAEAKSK